MGNVEIDSMIKSVHYNFTSLDIITSIDLNGDFEESYKFQGHFSELRCNVIIIL